MKKILFIFIGLFFSFSVFAKSLPPVSFDLDSQPVANVVRMVYIEAYKERPYFVDPAVLQDVRLVSFRYSSTNGDFHKFFVLFLKNLGYSLDFHSGADIIKPIPPSEVIKLSIAEDLAKEIFIYRPRYRDGSYLVELLTPLFSGKFTSQRSVSVGHSGSSPQPSSSSSSTSVVPSTPAAPSGSALAQMDKQADQLVFYGSAREVVVLKSLLTKVDSGLGQVSVTGAVYEVQRGENHGSALSLVGSILSGKLNFSFGAASPADNFINLKLFDISAIIQALDTDSRFKILSAPQVRVSSGKSAQFTVGEQVPVLGALSYPQNGPPVQSVDYRSAGVIFSITPDVHDSGIDLHVDQQISSFVQTTTGVNNSPTLTTRHISTDVSVDNGDLFVIGGLIQSKDSASSTGFSFFPLRSRASQSSDSEILVFIQVKRI